MDTSTDTHTDAPPSLPADAVRAHAPALCAAACALLRAEAQWEASPSLRAPAAQLLCLCLAAGANTEGGQAAGANIEGGQAAGANTEGGQESPAVALGLLCAAMRAAADDEGGVATPPNTGGATAPLPASAAIASAACGLLRLARLGVAGSPLASLAPQLVTTVREPALASMAAAAKAALGEPFDGAAAAACACLATALAEFIAEDPAWADGAELLTATISGRFSGALGESSDR